MDSLAARWHREAPRRHQPPASPESDEPGVRLDVERTVELAAPRSAVWALLSEPSLLLGAGDDAFALPVPGDERWCVVRRSEGGTIGRIVEVIERDEGRRITFRSFRVGPSQGLVTEWTLADAPTGATQVHVRSTALVRATEAERMRHVRLEGIERALTRMAGALAGSPLQPGPVRGPAPDLAASEQHALRPVTRHPVVVERVIPRHVDDVWAAVLDAGTFTLHAPPSERAGVVPSTPVAQVGELRCLVVPIHAMPSVAFFEVVGLGPGHRLVLRHHSLSHPTDSTTTVAPHPAGALVTCSQDVIAHPPDEVRQVEVVRQAWLDYLERLNDELADRVPARPEPTG